MLPESRRSWVQPRRPARAPSALGALVVLRLRPKSDPSVSSVVHGDRKAAAFAETPSERVCRGRSLCRSRFRWCGAGLRGVGVASLTQPIRAYSKSSSTLQLIGSSKGSISCCLTSCMSLLRASAAPSIWRMSPSAVLCERPHRNLSARPIYGGRNAARRKTICGPQGRALIHFVPSVAMAFLGRLEEVGPEPELGWRSIRTSRLRGTEPLLAIPGSAPVHQFPLRSVAPYGRWRGEGALSTRLQDRLRPAMRWTVGTKQAREG
jgi:hypothetical protein